LATIDPNIKTADQNEQLGTAHAVKTASHLIKDGEKVLILYGDVPLISSETISALINSDHECTLLSMTLSDPSGYGRIISNEENLALRIIEQKDASDEEKKIQEVFTGVLLVDGSLLKLALNQINNHNAANEYYLTDLVEILSSKGVKINCIQANPDEVLGANTKHELHELESILRKMSSEKLLEQGITLLDATRVDVRGVVVAGKDCTVDVNVIFEGKVTLGENVTIKSNVVLQDVSIGDNSIIESFSHLASATVGSNCNIGPYARLERGLRNW
jgi:bifunctional UDP-N-acetylglucosamine pyrophosphorylase/glucosamine-1-phosphate N-acetyltransferase